MVQQLANIQWCLVMQPKAQQTCIGSGPPSGWESGATCNFILKTKELLCFLLLDERLELYL